MVKWPNGTELNEKRTFIEFCIFQLDPVEDTLQMASLSAYSVCMFAQILGPSYMGSRLLTACEGITRAIYGSRWIERNMKCKRAIIILAERTLRPMAIYAGGLFLLSLPTFLSVSDYEYCISHTNGKQNSYFFDRFAVQPIHILLC